MVVSVELHAAVTSTPVKEYEIGRTLELVWTFQNREKFLTPAGIRNPDHPAGTQLTVCTSSKSTHFVGCVKELSLTSIEQCDMNMYGRMQYGYMHS
jgi:hypothetical protein